MKLNMNLSKIINIAIFLSNMKTIPQFCYFKLLFFKSHNRNKMPQNYSCPPSIMLFTMLNKYFILLYIMLHILP